MREEFSVSKRIQPIQSPRVKRRSVCAVPLKSNKPFIRSPFVIFSAILFCSVISRPTKSTVVTGGILTRSAALIKTAYLRHGGVSVQQRRFDRFKMAKHETPISGALVYRLAARTKGPPKGTRPSDDDERVFEKPGDLQLATCRL